MISSALERAADVIAAHGWTTYALGNEEGGFCAIGALIHVESNVRIRAAATNFLRISLIQEHQMSATDSSIYAWNDRSDQHIVVHQLRLAAKKAVPVHK